jgi:hypothetical protein
MAKEMLESARVAMDGNSPRLLSQTIYSFQWESKTFSIADFDIIVLPRGMPCRAGNKNLTLKSIRKGGDYKGTFFECDTFEELTAVISKNGKSPQATKLCFQESGNGLIEVSAQGINLHAGKYYVARLEYKVAADTRGNNKLMFAGAIQPSDYHEFCRMIDVPVNARKIMRFVAHATRPFTAWFFDPQDNNLFPDPQPACERGAGGYFAERTFAHEIQANSLRARYFSVFVDMPGSSGVPHRDGIQWPGGSDDAPLGIGA